MISIIYTEINIKILQLMFDLGILQLQYSRYVTNLLQQFAWLLKKFIVQETESSAIFGQ